MAKKEFNIPKFSEFEIKENGETVGHVRVKPSGIMWSPKGSHDWYGVTLEDFGAFAKKKGKKQKK